MYLYFKRLKTFKQQAKFFLVMVPALFAYGIYGVGYTLESFALWLNTKFCNFVEE